MLPAAGQAAGRTASDSNSMDDILIPRLLDESMIGRAYTLVRNLAPNVTSARWREFAGPHVQSRSPNWPHGFMSVQNAGGYIFGLYRFEVRDTLYVSRVFCADNIIVANLPGRDRIWAVMAGTMENLGRTNGCHSIRAELFNDLDLSDGERAWMTTACAESGYALDGSRAFKLLAYPPETAASLER
jgi:hypothetical protein